MTDTAITVGEPDTVEETKKLEERRQIETEGQRVLASLGAVVHASFTLNGATFRPAQSATSKIDALVEGMTPENRHPNLFAGPPVGNEEW